MAPGSVSLVHNGCRNRELATIIPHQPAKYRDRPNEVFLDFEAFLLSSMKEKATLWIHSQIKACINMADCTPDFCVDLYEPSGHGRKRRQIESTTASTANTTTVNGPMMQRAGNSTAAAEFKRFKENIEYTVIMPGQVNKKVGLLIDLTSQCRGALLISSFFVFIITLCCSIVSAIRTGPVLLYNSLIIIIPLPSELFDSTTRAQREKTKASPVQLRVQHRLCRSSDGSINETGNTSSTTKNLKTTSKINTLAERALHLALVFELCISYAFIKCTFTLFRK